MFTQNPVTGADERLIEASWGLGEAVVAGHRHPRPLPHRPLGPGARAQRRAASGSRSASLPSGGTVEEKVPPELVEQLCLDDDQLAELNELAGRCEQVYGPRRDIEWAFAGRDALPAPVPGDHAGEARSRPTDPPRRDPVDALQRVPLFADLDRARGRADRPPVQGAPLRRRARRSSRRARAARPSS